jgi:hypothetical protein
MKVWVINYRSRRGNWHILRTTVFADQKTASQFLKRQGGGWIMGSRKVRKVWTP